MSESAVTRITQDHLDQDKFWSTCLLQKVCLEGLFFLKNASTTQIEIQKTMILGIWK